MKFFKIFKSSGYPVPYEYRLYIDEEDIPKLPRGIHIYRGTRGALYVDVRELKELKRKAGGRVNNNNNNANNKRDNKLSFGEEERGQKENNNNDGDMSWNEMVKRIRQELEKYNIEVEILDEEQGQRDDESKWKSAYINGKIRIFLRNIPKEERIKVSDTYRLIERGELNKAMNTLGWYYYHSVGHLMFREYGFEQEWLDELREYLDKVELREYSKIDLEEFWCEVFALYVLTDGKAEKWLGKELNALIRKWLGIMFQKGYSNKDRIGGYVYDSYDIEIGVKKTYPKSLSIEIKKFLNILKMYKDEGWWFTTVLGEDDELILKEYFSKAIQNYGTATTKALEEGRFWFKYAGLTLEQSRKVNQILEWIVKKRYWKYKEYVIRKLMKEVGIDRKKAELIATTELSYMANLAREIAYRENTNVEKFVYVNEPDACDKCKEVARLSKRGVTLDELKQIIKDVCGNSARGFLCHPRCRCSFRRKYIKPKYMKQFEVI